MTDSTFKAHNAADLFTMLPALFGFHPRESLVAIATVGPNHRIGFRLRMDIPDSTDVELAARQAAGHLRRQHADGVILLAVSSSAEPVGALVKRLREELADLPIVEAARGDGERYWSYLCDDEDCCPSAGTPYGDQCSPVVADAIFRGESILPDREALVRRFDGPSGETAESMTLLATTVAASVGRQCAGLDRRLIAVAGVHELMPIFQRRANAATQLTDDEIAGIMVWCALIPVRDAVWSRFDRESAADWLAVFTEVAQRSVPPFEPAVLSLAAFASWLTGDGAQSLIAAERALRAKQDYSFAQLILHMIDTGFGPDQWTGFEAEDTMTS